MKILKVNSLKSLARLLEVVRAKQRENPKIEAQVRAIIKQVQTKGDEALVRLTKRFDGFLPTRSTIRISGPQIKSAYNQVS